MNRDATRNPHAPSNPDTAGSPNTANPDPAGNPDIEVDGAAVRAATGSAAELAAQVSSAAQDPPAQVIVPRWSTTDAAAEATEAVRRQAANIAADIAEAADQIIAAVVDYEDADQRAASRMRAAG